MKILTPGSDLDHFFDQLCVAEHRALLLDYDGTLAPFQEERDQAFPYPGVRKLITQILTSGHTRVVLISGRTLECLKKLLGIEPLPEMWGSHGRERYRPQEGYRVAEIDERAKLGLGKAKDWIEQRGFADWCEEKPASVALHFRGKDAQAIESLRSQVLASWPDLGKEYGLALHEFDGGLELRVPGENKGDAVNTILSEMPSSTVAAYLGDDLTDEDGFRALQDRGLSVLVRKELRSTQADVWIHPPEELLEFLMNWKDKSEGKE